MEAVVDLAWDHVPDSPAHPVVITAPAGTAGTHVDAALTRLLGTPVLASVDGHLVSTLTWGEGPLVDGARITVTVRTPATDSDPSTADLAVPRIARPSATGQVGTAAVELRVVAGHGCGRLLTVPRGRHVIVPGADGPHVRDTGAGVPVTVDHDGLHSTAHGCPLRAGDTVAAGSSLLSVEDPAAGDGPVSWPAPGGSVAGLEATDGDPSTVLRVPEVSTTAATTGLVVGCLPLVLGIVMAVSTHLWYFLLFSALGAVTSLFSWVSGRTARRRRRGLQETALAQDRARCEAAAPSVAELVRRCEALAAGHPLRMDAPPQQSPPSRFPGAEAHQPLWVRVGSGSRPAAVHTGDRSSGTVLNHRRAPVLVDLRRAGTVTVLGSAQARAGIMNALALQLCTGPTAGLVWSVAADAGWVPPASATIVRAPEPHGRPGAAGEHLAAVEVRSPATAGRPPAPGAIRFVLAGARSSAAGTGRATTPCEDGVVLESGNTAVGPVGGVLRLRCTRPGVVAGLTADRSCVEVPVDTVTRSVLERSVTAWHRAAGGGTRTGSPGPVPGTVGTHELLPAPERVGDVWFSNARSAGLATPVGCSAAGTASIRLDDENPHLLVAGTTGCGKSEVLRTLVTGLATHHGPDRLEFLFVDFKGGAALAPLTGLPHRSTLLTDLHPMDVRRALEFLRSELRRREHVLADHGVADLRSLLETSPPGEGAPLRSLVVVVDEARMLLEAFSTAGQELAAVATVGRSMGVHLVLATQRPQGNIPADVRANISQALCLRVRTEADSLDVIGSPLAARIPATRPGRGYLDRGDGSPLEVQTAILTPWPPATDPVVRVTPLTSHGPRSGDPALESAATRVTAREVISMLTTAATTGATVPGRTDGHCPPVPDPLPSASTAQLPVPDPAEGPSGLSPVLDLGPAENASAHWTGRARWSADTDGTLLLLGQPEAVTRPLGVLLAQLLTVHAPSSSGPAGSAPVAIYLIASGSGWNRQAAAWARHGLLAGFAHSHEAAEIHHLVTALHAGCETWAAGGSARRAVVVVEDWDRCAQVLRSSPWAHVEDDLLALAATGAGKGLHMILSGDRILSTGRASQLGGTRLYHPYGRDETQEIHWPRLPAVTPVPGRVVIAGAAASRCTDHPGPQGHTYLAVAQIPELPEGRFVLDTVPTPARTSPATATSVAPTWPRSIPLPAVLPAGSLPVPAQAPGLQRCRVRRPGSAQDVPGEVSVGLSRDGTHVTTALTRGTTVLITGPARSGKTTAARWLTSRLGTRRVKWCHWESVSEMDDDLAGTRDGTVIVIDDAHALPDPVLRALTERWVPGRGPSPGPRGSQPGRSVPGPLGVSLVLTARFTDHLASSLPPVVSWRHELTTLLLRPRRGFDGEQLGMPLAGLPLGGPPGRGYWGADGAVTQVQIPFVDARQEAG